MYELIKKFDAIWISVAFAEAGEQETAKTFLDSELCEVDGAEICQTM
jgi:hypothetical protein